MKGNTEEKSLTKVNEKSVFHKIKKFFRNLFNKNTIDKNDIVNKENISAIQRDNEASFMTKLKNIKSEETKILKLQKAYREGNIEEKDMTEEQISSLLNLYDSQIASLKKSNEIRKQKLLEYRQKYEKNLGGV